MRELDKAFFAVCQESKFFLERKIVTEIKKREGEKCEYNLLDYDLFHFRLFPILCADFVENTGLAVLHFLCFKPEVVLVANLWQAVKIFVKF